MALKVLYEEAKPQGLKVSQAKTKVQSIGSSLDDTVQSVHIYGKDNEATERFMYLGSRVHTNDGSCWEATQQIHLYTLLCAHQIRVFGIVDI